MRSSLSLCPPWALWVQEIRFWGRWQNSDFGTFRNPAKIRASESDHDSNAESPVPGSQTHRRSTSHSTQITSASAFMFLLKWLYRFLGLPWRLTCNKSTWSAGDMGSIPDSGRCPREGNGNPLQYSCLGNPWTEEPSWLQSMGSQRTRDNLVMKPPPHYYQSNLYFIVANFEKYW